MRFRQSEIIEAARAEQLPPLAFGNPISEYPLLGEVVCSEAGDSYDYFAVSECRRCGGLTTTLAMNDGGDLMPMSASRGPQCTEERCGDKVAAVCFGIFEIVAEDDEVLISREMEDLAASVQALNDSLRAFGQKHGGVIRLHPAFQEASDGSLKLTIEVAQTVALIGGSDDGRLGRDARE